MNKSESLNKESLPSKQDLQAFLQTPLYREFCKLGEEIYQGYFFQALNEKLSAEARIMHLERMKGLQQGLGLFNALLNILDDEIKE